MLGSTSVPLLLIRLHNTKGTRLFLAPLTTEGSQRPGESRNEREREKCHLYFRRHWSHKGQKNTFQTCCLLSPVRKFWLDPEIASKDNSEFILRTLRMRLRWSPIAQNQYQWANQRNQILHFIYMPSDARHSAAKYLYYDSLAVIAEQYFSFRIPLLNGFTNHRKSFL